MALPRSPSTIAATRLFTSAGSALATNSRFGLPTAARSFSDELEDRLRGALREHERLDDVVLAGLGGAAFDHHDGVFGTGDHQVDVSFFLLLERGVGDELAFESDDTHADDRAVPRDVGDVQRRAGAGEGEHVGGVDLVGREHGRDDLRVALEAFGEQRTKGAVHEATDQDFVVAQAPFALEEAARDLARGERLLDVLTGHGEEVETGPLIGRDRGDENDALAVRNEDRAVRLLGETTRLEGQRTTVDHHGFTNE